MVKYLINLRYRGHIHHGNEITSDEITIDVYRNLDNPDDKNVAHIIKADSFEMNPLKGSSLEDFVKELNKKLSELK